jgi:predicted SAM-dependent methyltransferase
MLIVDLGCGYLKFSEPDAEIIGLDLCRYSNDIVASVLQTPLKAEIADAVAMRQILEHVYPEGLVREAWRILKPQSKLLIETPNALYIFRILKALRHQEANPYPEHIQIFTAAELRNLLGRNGFINMQISYYNIDVSNANFLLRWLKKLIAYLTDKLFPMLDRDVRAIAVKDAEAKFAEYR